MPPKKRMQQGKDKQEKDKKAKTRTKTNTIKSKEHDNKEDTGVVVTTVLEDSESEAKHEEEEENESIKQMVSKINGDISSKAKKARKPAQAKKPSPVKTKKAGYAVVTFLANNEKKVFDSEKEAYEALEVLSKNEFDIKLFGSKKAAEDFCRMPQTTPCVVVYGNSKKTKYDDYQKALKKYSKIPETLWKIFKFETTEEAEAFFSDKNKGIISKKAITTSTTNKKNDDNSKPKAFQNHFSDNLESPFGEVLPVVSPQKESVEDSMKAALERRTTKIRRSNIVGGTEWKLEVIRFKGNCRMKEGDNATVVCFSMYDKARNKDFLDLET